MFKIKTKQNISKYVYVLIYRVSLIYFNLRFLRSINIEMLNSSKEDPSGFPTLRIFMVCILIC